MYTQSLNAPDSSTPSWDDIMAFESEEEEIKHESQMLMFSFLSEVEKYQTLQDINKKKLSQKIKTSASYLTQLFRGNKPLNFETIAKMQKALNISFHVYARPNIDEMVVNEDIFLDFKYRYKTNKGTWLWKNFAFDKHDDKYTQELDKNLIKNALDYYEDKAIPA